ncbi:10384_t:CDS:1 [Funneliformis geosporum]|uniref:3664_t:CDS:1 n=1 Tax=Funneliformis geosporum TaxID=1117311 RepID=A0A9W4T425_9GLOM|nr:10384_t:CDS:1 [Funneliformis geosporum]CAI2191776.1 3664_t:CDS:1 [Funneliformis geosporum]
MALIHSNFNFTDKPWWRPDYDDRNTQYFISNTERLQRAISLSVGNEEELFWQGYMDLHRERYLIECISAEGDIDLDVIRQLLNKSWFKIFLSYIREIMFPRILFDPFSRLASFICRKMFGNYIHRIIFGPSRSSRLAKKVQNLRDTINGIFPYIFFPDLPVNRFTPMFAKQLHQQVGNGLIDNVGQYRTQYVMASQDNFVYLAPNLIENKMEVLFRHCREEFAKEDLELEEAVKFGACFLAHFLFIHPFMNGNGRVARLLLSYLLSRFTVVPLSLYSGTKTRDVYLQCLREAQWFREPPFRPSALASFILENIYKTSINICAVMDIDIQND